MLHKFPAAPACQVTLANWRTAPFNQWGFRNVRNIVPTAPIRRPDRYRKLARASRGLDRLEYVDRHGQSQRLDAVLARTHTDALLVMHAGVIIEERYFGGMRPDDQHILMSVSKSVTAVLAGILQDHGYVDFNASVASYIPEVGACAYAQASVQQLMDMQVGVAFDEDYLATSGAMIAYRQATGWNPGADGVAPSDLRSFLLTLQAQGESGAPFRYTSPNTDLLGWVLERAAGKSLAELFSSYLWQPLGAEFDAYITVDRLGAPRAAGGICMSLRDLARFGLMMLEQGSSDGNAVVSSDWVCETTTSGDQNAWAAGKFSSFFPGGCYHNKWYQTRNALDAYCGLGIHGQFVYVAPGSGTVIARFGSDPSPLDPSATMTLIDMLEGIASELG
jgi:CubicO group peptidase (beta-lactamase class C family)